MFGGEGTLIQCKELCLIRSIIECFGKSTLDFPCGTQSEIMLHYLLRHGSAFKLGFFSPVNSTSRYLGIWHNNVSVFKVIWVSNREKPFKDSSEVLTIFDDGNLIILNGQKVILWSLNVTSPVVNSSAWLLDSWNIVLQAGPAQCIWD